MKATLVVIAILLGLVALSLASRSCDTASRMADQTVFNADKHVWSYEQFKAQHAQYEQYKAQLADAEERLASLKKEGVRSGQEYDNLVTEVQGIRNMIRRIAADYNAMSKVAYQKVWKSSDLPERLE